MSSGSDEGTDWTVRPKHENQMVQLKSEKVGFRESDYLKPLERFIKFIGKKRTPPLDSRYIFYAQLDRGMAYKDVYRRKLVCVIMSFSCFDSYMAKLFKFRTTVVSNNRLKRCIQDIHLYIFQFLTIPAKFQSKEKSNLEAKEFIWKVVNFQRVKVKSMSGKVYLSSVVK